MNTYLSNKLTFFSFWLIVLVVILHSLNVDYKNCFGLICNLQFLISHKITQIAVPLFFCITGYLFFLRADRDDLFSIDFFINNGKKRIKTIFVPFIFWCVFWFMFMFFLQQISFLSKIFSSPLYKMNFLDQITNLFLSPINYPFWFLRDLILLFVISPFIFLIVKYLKFIALVILFIFALFIDNLIEINNVRIFLILPLFYFSLGSFLALNKINLLLNWDRWIVALLVMGWIIFNFISLYLDQYNSSNMYLLKFFNHIKDLLGCIALWSLYDILNIKQQWKNYKFYNYSFFIFAFHGVPTLIVVKIIQMLTSNYNLLFLLFILTPLLILLIAITIGKILKTNYPNTYNLLTGYR